MQRARYFGVSSPATRAVLDRDYGIKRLYYEKIAKETAYDTEADWKIGFLNI
jgi:hypothetical protein